MINIKRGEINKIILRLDRVAPYYLFKFKSVQSGEEIFFTAENISPSTRFFECKIYEVSGTPDSIALTASQPQIELKYEGSYDWTLWGIDDNILEPNDNILDRGKMVYTGSEFDTFFFEEDLEKLSIFNISDGLEKYEFVEGDSDENSVFVSDLEKWREFDVEEGVTFVFEPEIANFFLLTEDNEILLTEEQEKLIWK